MVWKSPSRSFDLLVLGHEVGLADELLPVELVAVVDIGQQILDIERAADVVDVLLEDGDARKARCDDGLLDLFVGIGEVERRDVDAGLHDLLDLGIDEVDDAREHDVLLGIGRLGHVDGIGQVVERNLALMGGLLADAAAGAHEDERQRVENPAQHRKRARDELRETRGQRLRQHLGQHLAEK